MSTLGCDQRLESVFSEAIEHARKREQAAFDEAVGARANSLVLYGAGNFGRRVLSGLRKNGLDALAFADANPALRNRNIEGVPIFSPEDAALRFGSTAAFIVCVWHPDPHSGVRGITEHLLAKGAGRVLPFVHLFWKYAETFLPHYFWDLPSKYLGNQAAIRRAYETFDEPASQTQFVDDLELRTSGVFRALPLPCAGPQYFPNELFHVSPDECFVDCGGYDGDTIRALVEETDSKFRQVVAFEADPRNFSRLGGYLAQHPEFRNQVAIHQTAVARTAGTLRFAATASANAAVASGGETVVNCVALDDILGNERPTMIKMDIEGSELDALKGAARVIALHKPVLAICLYHRPEHLWEIPLHMKSVEPEARLYLRSYAVDGFDTVCYAVPPARSVQGPGKGNSAAHRTA